MQVWTKASGNTARIASGKPFRPPRGSHPQNDHTGGCATHTSYAARADARANRTLAFSSEVDTGSREEPKVRASEHATNQNLRAIP